MPGRWVRAVVVALVLAGAPAVRSPRADDDALAEPAPAGAGRQPSDRPPGIDLAAHVDINVVLPTNQWRVSGGLQNVVVAVGGRLVIDGNLTIGGESVADPAERVRRADEAVMIRLRRAQRDVLAAVAADRRVPPERRRSLELATEADVRRVLTDVALLRARYAGERANLGDEAWQRFQKDVQLCRRALADPFGPDSLFAAARAGLEPEAPE